MVDTQPIVPRLRLLRQPISFSGTCNQDVVDWVAEFNLIFNASGLGDVDKAKYLPLYLEGTPMLWYKSLAADDRKSMADLQKALIEKFAPRNSADVSLRNLWQRMLLPGERMLDYVYSKLSLCRTVQGDMGIDQQIAWVKRGLPKCYLERLRNVACPTIEELVTELLELESFGPEPQPIGAIGADREMLRDLMREVLTEHDSRGKESSDHSVHSENQEYRRPIGKGNANSYRSDTGMPGNRTRQKFRGNCWRCGLLGHTRADCHVNLRGLKDDGTCMRSDPSSLGLSRNPRR